MISEIWDAPLAILPKDINADIYTPNMITLDNIILPYKKTK